MQQYIERLVFFFLQFFYDLTQEKYEKGLKDARARELMYAEEAALTDKVTLLFALLLL